MDFQNRVSPEELRTIRGIGTKNIWRLPVRCSAISSIGSRIRDHPLPLPDLPARQRCSIGDMGGIRLG